MTTGATCQNCGTPVAEGALFCSRCGVDVTAITPGEAATVEMPSIGSPAPRIKSTMRQTLRDATLAQLARLHDGLLPVGEIRDWPDLPIRAVMLDIARDNLFTTIQPEQIAELAVLAAQVDTADVQTIRFSPPTYPEYLTTKAINKIRNRFANVFAEPTASASPTPKPTATPKPCPRS